MYALLYHVTLCKQDFKSQHNVFYFIFILQTTMAGGGGKIKRGTIHICFMEIISKENLRSKSQEGLGSKPQEGQVSKSQEG